ncbi:hypothetical protein M3193_14650 [Sporosarcina luteola]|uniref:hypothetical protein n=1 Tax=Sporosarcina luteola TaxID=582850 RepID=UPI0020424088|nr:hypothetical protein [Sporosarcina luteola]MCM3745364.1 hypothetical protein [Sporosarcina luteola]
MSLNNAKKIKIERLEAIEKKHGVELNVNAYEIKSEYHNYDEARILIEVIGDIVNPLHFMASIYNEQGELIGVGSRGDIRPDTFDGIDHIEIEIAAPPGKKIDKVRVYPQRVR